MGSSIDGLMVSQTDTGWGSMSTGNDSPARFTSVTIEYKKYELTDHLGNVRAVVSDGRLGSFTPGLFTSTAGVIAYNDYYPFGMLMQGRTMSAERYRFGFNGKEKDDDLGGGSGNMYDYGFRIYNPRIGKFLSVDPLTREYPWYTPYQFAGNKPIEAIDLDGLEESYFMNSIWYIQEISKLDLTTEEGVKRMLELANSATKKILTDEQSQYLWEKNGEKGIAPYQAGTYYYDLNFRGVRVAGTDENGNYVELYNNQEQVIEFGGFSAKDRPPHPRWFEPYGLTGQYGWDHGGKQLFFGTVGVVFSAYGLVYGSLSLGYQVITWASLINDVDNIGGVFVGESSEGLSISLLENDKVKISVQATKGLISVSDLVTSFGFKNMSLNKSIIESAEFTQDGYSVYLDYETFKSIKENMDEED
jgi:RHS repeat-associated protein